MNRNIILLFMLFIVIGMNGQISVPERNPYSKLHQTVGLTEIIIEYSRPQIRGRKIFGELISYDRIWRTGANETTKLIIDKAIIINGTVLSAGTYSIFTIPNHETWEIVFYMDHDNPHLSQFDENKIALKFKAEVIETPNTVNTLTFRIDNVSNSSAILAILWENTYVGIPFEVETDKQIMASIEGTLSSPSANDYYTAAVYYLETDKDIAKAKFWIDKAIELRSTPAFWYHRQQALIYAKAGDRKGAVKAAQVSLSLAVEAGNSDFVAMNSESLSEWGYQEIYCCSNHAKKHCGKKEQLKKLTESGCEGFN